MMDDRPQVKKTVTGLLFLVTWHKRLVVKFFELLADTCYDGCNLNGSLPTIQEI